jgi:hypothetical protein
MKKLWGLLLGSVLMVCPLGAAQATTFNLGPLGPGFVDFGKNVLAGAFTHDFTFSPSFDGGALGASVTNVSIKILGNTIQNITNLSLKLFSGTPGGAHSQLAGGPLVTEVNFTGNLPNGNPFFLEVTGTGTGSARPNAGHYSGGLGLVSTVPLPAAFPLMAAGVAALGLAARRRRKEAA